jgi:glycosyl transferase family 2
MNTRQNRHLPATGGGHGTGFETITVVTLTRKRVQLLRRAIESVRSQDYTGRIIHFVLIDNCPETAEYLQLVGSRASRTIVPQFRARELRESVEGCVGIDWVYPHIARMLNFAVRNVNSRWIAFLDDDNEYESNHLSTLVDCAQVNSCSAVHSLRKIYFSDGMPYLTKRFPWCADASESHRIYDLLCAKGVWLRNSNILRDRAGPSGLAPFRNSTILSSQDPVFLVDTSAWLIERELLLKYPVPEEFSSEEIGNSTAPDDKLLQLFLENGVRIVSTGLPTLRYYLGGISNQ